MVSKAMSPPKKSWNDDYLANTNKQWFLPGFQVVRFTDFATIHSMSETLVSDDSPVNTNLGFFVSSGLSAMSGFRPSPTRDRQTRTASTESHGALRPLECSALCVKSHRSAAKTSEPRCVRLETLWGGGGGGWGVNPPGELRRKEEMKPILSVGERKNYREET